MLVEEKLRTMGIILPEVMPVIADGYVPAFAPFAITGSLIHVAGRLSKKGGEVFVGKVGANINLEEAVMAARAIAIELVAVLKHAAGGELDRITRIGRMLVMVNGAPGFREPHRVADGASTLLTDIFGDLGRHARSALVASELPFGACIEIDLTAEFR